VRVKGAYRLGKMLHDKAVKVKVKEWMLMSDKDKTKQTSNFQLRTENRLSADRQLFPDRAGTW
jgi:hypothetical protein